MQKTTLSDGAGRNSVDKMQGVEAAPLDELSVDEYEAKKKMIITFMRKAFTVIIFICFLLTYNLLVLSESTYSYTTLKRHLISKFEHPPSVVNLDTGAALAAPSLDKAICKHQRFLMHLFEQVQSIAIFWEYIADVLLDALFVEDAIPTTIYAAIAGGTASTTSATDGGILISDDELVTSIVFMPPIDERQYNRLLGAVRIRTIRVRSGEGCNVADPFNSYFEYCFPPYDESREESVSYGAITADQLPITHTDANSNPSYKKADYGGKVAKYSSSGYETIIPTNRSEAMEALAALQSSQYVDVATRAIFVDLNVWNSNMGCFAAIRVAFEVTPSGLWYNKVQLSILSLRHMNPLALKQPEELMLVVAEFMLALFVLYYISEEISELSILKLSDGWNLVDWANLILLMVAFALRLKAFVDATSLDLEAASTDTTQYVDLLPTATTVQLTRRIHAFNIILAWLKAIKFLGFLPYVDMLVLTIRKSWQLVMSFLCLFLVVLLGFSVAYNVGYGEIVPQLAFVGDALFFLGRAFIGGAELEATANASFWGSFLLCLLVVVLWFLGFRCLYATIAYFVSSARSARWSADAGSDTLLGAALAKGAAIKEYVLKSFDWKNFMRTNLQGLYTRWYLPRTQRLRELRQRTKSRRQKLDGKMAEYCMPVYDEEGNEVASKIQTANGGKPAEAEGQASSEEVRYKKRLKAVLSSKPGKRWAATALPDLSLNAQRKSETHLRSTVDAESDESSSDDGLVKLGPLQPSKIRKRRRQLVQQFQLYGQADDNVRLPVTTNEVFESAEAMTDQLLGRVKGVGREARNDVKQAEESLMFLRDAVQLLNRRIKDLAIQQEDVLAIQ
ncbi:Polycystic kidney disease 2-like 1 [Perkinsus olseni]|uniref:Polycystic kidney disease 2-like 1 n=1 Tax=Perkinsus olseni TaxID=32597 RepID=A0A7J6MQC2_PEROL|nr:Polycystic kidney disease 2-like 1 [Perkinsus olseni]